jgi:hypothetical protein
MAARKASTVRYGRTTTGPGAIVVFCCPKCNASYKAVQHRQWTERKDAFECPVCEMEVYSWRGKYNYIDWTVIDSRPAQRSKRQSKNVAKH